MAQATKLQTSRFSMRSVMPTEECPLWSICETLQASQSESTSQGPVLCKGDRCGLWSSGSDQCSLPMLAEVIDVQNLNRPARE